MNRTVTPEETLQLFEFCEKKGVKYYDVQTELVDHLATAIEDIWKSSPDLLLEDAAWLVHQKFGTQGFIHLIDQKRKILSSKYRKLIWHYLIEFFKWPKILLTICLMSLSYLILGTLNITWMDIFYFSITFSFLSGGCALYFKLRYKISQKSKILLFELIYKLEHNSISGNMVNGLMFSCVALIQNENTIKIGNWMLFLISFLFVIFVVLMYAEYIYIQKKAIQYIKEQFPQYASN